MTNLGLEPLTQWKPRCMFRSVGVSLTALPRFFMDRFAEVSVLEVWFWRNQGNTWRVCGFCMN